MSKIIEFKPKQKPSDVDEYAFPVYCCRLCNSEYLIVPLDPALEVLCGECGAQVLGVNR